MSNPQRPIVTGNNLMSLLNQPSSSSSSSYVAPSYGYQANFPSYVAPSAPSLQLPNTNFYRNSPSTRPQPNNLMSLLRNQPSSGSSSSYVAPAAPAPFVFQPAAPAPFVFQPAAPAPFVFQPAAPAPAAPAPAPPQLPGTFWRNSTPTRPQDNLQQRGAPPMPLSNAAGNNSSGYQLGASSSSPSIVTPQQRAAEAAMRRYQQDMEAQRQAAVDAAFGAAEEKYNNEPLNLNQVPAQRGASSSSSLDENDIMDRLLENGQLKSDPNSGTKTSIRVHKPALISTRQPLRVKGVPQKSVAQST